ncbi:MAG TPA: ribosomal protein L7/L12 [Actinopolymorphaceae bacterium]|nr:ribosomal protein L7/L12 [Actinopolymorphaceae bacterium]
MNDILLVLIVGLVIVGIMYVVRTRDSDQEGVSDGAGRASNLLSQPVDPRVMSVVVALLGRSRKIQAIDELRRATGLGLADAKDLIEAIQTGHRPPAVVIKGEAFDVDGGHSNPAAGHDSGLAARARSLRDQGREHDAVELVCRETGMGTTDAQKFVRALG